MKRIIAAVITGAMFVALIVLLGRYDVASIGPAGTSVGFSHINQTVHGMTGENILWYEITDYMGYVAIAICVLFALAGLVQLIRRRSLFKVDGEILALGGLFVVVIGLYVLFEKFIVNYRPIIMPGETEPEASFPSSHTMLIVTVMIATAIIIGKYVSSGALCALIRFVCVAAARVAVGGRLYCGVHWFTDIAGGLLLSITLLLVFSAIVSKIQESDIDADSVGYSFDAPVHVSEKDRVIDGYRCKH